MDYTQFDNRALRLMLMKLGVDRSTLINSDREQLIEFIEQYSKMHKMSDEEIKKLA